MSPRAPKGQAETRGDPTLTWLDSARHDIALFVTPSPKGADSAEG
jgi:hypothetical protein